jgi:CheY-like chemotaxis protein
VENRDSDISRPSGAGFQGLKVLLVEDEATIACDLETTLRELGCAIVFWAFSVDQALAALRTDRPDVALLDLRLADRRSTPVAEALAAAGVPFAVVTGYDQGRLEEPVLCAAPYLGKPYGRTALRQALAQLAARPPAGR